MFTVDYLTQDLVLHEHPSRNTDWDHLAAIRGGGIEPKPRVPVPMPLARFTLMRDADGLSALGQHLIARLELAGPGLYELTSHGRHGAHEPIGVWDAEGVRDAAEVLGRGVGLGVEHGLRPEVLGQCVGHRRMGDDAAAGIGDGLHFKEAVIRLVLAEQMKRELYYDPPERGFEREIRKRSIPGVHLAGLLSGPALSAAYASADIFAFPSVTETFGNVLLEAMASGLPSIVAAAGGVLEFTEHGRNGWLVEPNSVEAIAGALDRLLTDPALRQRIATNALATAAARRWDLIDDQLIVEYRRVVRAGRVHRAA